MADVLKVVEKLKYQLGEALVRSAALSTELEEAQEKLLEAEVRVHDAEHEIEDLKAQLEDQGK